MNKAQDAVGCFSGGYNCCQALFSTYAPEFGLNSETALKIASSFGGGMARMGETCGVVTGAFMIIGLKYGNIEAGNTEAKERNYEVIREFVNRFTKCQGSIKCKELLGCDISTPEGSRLAWEQNLFKTRCPKFVEDASKILEQLI